MFLLVSDGPRYAGVTLRVMYVIQFFNVNEFRTQDAASALDAVDTYM